MSSKHGKSGIKLKSKKVICGIIKDEYDYLQMLVIITFLSAQRQLHRREAASFSESVKRD